MKNFDKNFRKYLYPYYCRNVCQLYSCSYKFTLSLFPYSLNKILQLVYMKVAGLIAPTHFIRGAVMKWGDILRQRALFQLYKFKKKQTRKGGNAVAAQLVICRACCQQCRCVFHFLYITLDARKTITRDRANATSV